MTLESTWCVIVNSHTCSIRKWKKWQALFDLHEIPYQLYFTHSISELSILLSELYAAKNKYFLFAGGDGTMHQAGNLLIHHAGNNSRDLVIGLLPCGTGNDWVRSFGVSKENIIRSLQEKKSAPLHVLRLQWADGSTRYAFNMVGAALDAAVVDAINNSRYANAGVLKYAIGLVATLFKPHSWEGTIIIDGKAIEDDWLTIEAGFGKYCGGGMYVLPHAIADNAGLLLMKQKSLVKIFTSLPKLYNGNISQQKEAITRHFTKLEIVHSNKAIPIEADGEWLGYTPVVITAEKGIIQRLT